MSNIIDILNGTKYANIIKEINAISIHGYTYNDLYKLETIDGRSYSLKIRPMDRYNIADSIKILSNICDPKKIIIGYKEILIKDNHYYLFSDWIDGIHPSISNRNELQFYFTELAIFNRNNICSGPYTSMYLDEKKFNTIDEMVDFEIEELLKQYSGKHSISYIKRHTDHLKEGLGCVILEDMNTGNMIKNLVEGLKFIDMDYITIGLNLYQFDHMNLLKRNKNEWWNITDEAKNCLVTYFETLKITNEKTFEQIKSIMVLQLLRELTFKVWNKEMIDYNEYDVQLDKIAAYDELGKLP